MAELDLSLSALVTGLADHLRPDTRGDAELFEEMELWSLDRERELLVDYLGCLCVESPAADLFASARLTELLTYHYWLRRTRAAGPDAPPVTRRFTHDVPAMAALGVPGPDGPPRPSPCQVTFHDGEAAVV
jgi:hypothetical protein